MEEETNVAPPAPPPPPPPGVVFVLDTIPLHPENDFTGTVPLLPPAHRLMENIIADAYYSAISTVMGSPLNRAGMVRAVYVHIRHKGFFQFTNPQGNTFDSVTPTRFHNMLRELFQSGRMVDPDTNEEMCRSIPDIASVFHAFPPNSPILGCLSGDQSENAVTIYDRVSNMTPGDHQALVFVVGAYAGGVVGSFVNGTVRVSSYPLNADACLSRVCSVLQDKWNIF